jgi:hypothetical protein
VRHTCCQQPDGNRSGVPEVSQGTVQPGARLSDRHAQNSQMCVPQSATPASPAMHQIGGDVRAQLLFQFHPPMRARRSRVA